MLKSLTTSFILAGLLTVGLHAQNLSIPDTASQASKWRPTGVRIGTDLLALIRTATSDDFRGWELNGDIDLHRYLFSVDIGYWGRSFVTDSSDYSNNGSYLRVGIDVNFLPDNPNGNVLFFGLRYARGLFTEDYTVIIKDELWGSFTEQYTNTNVGARWVEATGGIKVRILKVIYLGYTARFKFFLKTGATPEMLPHDVPGYGTTNKQSTWGFNYQVFFHLPLTFKKNGN